MRSPYIYITGLGHSGSTFLAQLFKECGWDLGQALTGGDDPRKGNEWEPLHAVAGWLEAHSLQTGVFGTYPGWYSVPEEKRERVRKYLTSALEQLDFPSVVKEPDGLQTLLLPIVRPGFTVVCHRDLQEWVRSSRASQEWAQYYRPEDLMMQGAMQLGFLLDTLEREGMPYTVVNYPSVTIPGHAWKKLGHILQVSEDELHAAHRRAFRPEWVGYSTQEEAT